MKLSHLLIADADLHAFARHRDIDTVRRLYLATGFGYAPAYLPAGKMLLRRIKDRLDGAMRALGAVEIELPLLVARSSINASKRVRLGFFDRFAIPLSVEGAPAYMMPTHEEIVALLAGRAAPRDDAPALYFQSGRKFRSEAEPVDAIRSAEFIMHDTYSVCRTADHDADMFERIIAAYCGAFAALGVRAYASQDVKDPLFGDVSRELIAPTALGADRAVEDGGGRCHKLDVGQAPSEKAWNGLEVGHAYRLFDVYAPLFGQGDRMGDGPVWFGGTGIGVDRLMIAMLDQNLKDGRVGLPDPVRPFRLAVRAPSPETRRALVTMIEEQGGQALELDIDDLADEVQLAAAAGLSVAHAVEPAGSGLALRDTRDGTIAARLPKSKHAIAELLDLAAGNTPIAMRA